MKMLKFFKRNIHIWRYHDGIQRTCRICGKHQINVVIINHGGYKRLLDNWRDLN